MLYPVGGETKLEKIVEVTIEDYRTYIEYTARRLLSAKKASSRMKSAAINFIIWLVVAVIFFTIFQSNGFNSVHALYCFHCCIHYYY